MMLKMVIRFHNRYPLCIHQFRELNASKMVPHDHACDLHEA